MATRPGCRAAWCTATRRQFVSCCLGKSARNRLEEPVTPDRGIKVPLPVIVGLDMAGEIAEVGSGVAGWKAGDRVLVNPLNKK